MISKSKTILAIIFLVAGGALIPTGFVINQVFVDQIAEGVPDALLGIQEEAVPALEDQLPPLATPDVLLGIEDEALNTLEEQLPPLATPDVLLGIEAEALNTLEEQLPVLVTPDVLNGLKEEAVAQLPALINGSGAVQAINQSILAVYAKLFSLPAAIEQWFNNATFSSWYPPTVLPMGPSEYTGYGNLSFTVTAQNRILDGFMGAPGLLEDELGIGLLSWMEFWSWAYANIGTNRTLMQLIYNADWMTQLYPLGGYIINYLWDVVVKDEYEPLPISYYAELVFYTQWANGTVVEDGIDLSLFKDTLPPGTTGLEAGVPIPTGLSFSQCMDLWDDSNPYGFVNDSGILVWVGALQMDPSAQLALSMAFSLSPVQLTILLNWLGNFMITLVPLLVLDETGYTISEIAQFAFYEQWANGTIQGEVLLPGGFLAELDASFAGQPYFEIGLPTASGLSLTETIALWDESNPLAFVNGDGIMAWIGAMQGDTSLQTLLVSTFFVTYLELIDLLTWLGGFMTVRVPQLLEYDTGYTVPELAQLAFYEQWANGTIQGEALLPDGFLAELDDSYAGEPYFEVGLPTASGLSVTETMALWDESDSLSFVNGDGVLVWLGAITNTTLQATLISSFGISTAELTALLAWLGSFVTVRVPQLIEYNTGFTVPELAQRSFYEQWANGTIQGEAILPDGFLAELDPPILGPPYFEVGLTEGATGLTISQVEILWDETSPYSLVSSVGIQKWYNALYNQSAAYGNLTMGIPGITTAQMNAILSWLPQFRDVIVNQLAQSELGLPMPPYTLGNILLISLTSAGGLLVLLGVVILARRM